MELCAVIGFANISHSLLQQPADVVCAGLDQQQQLTALHLASSCISEACSTRIGRSVLQVTYQSCLLLLLIA